MAKTSLIALEILARVQQVIGNDEKCGRLHRYIVAPHSVGLELIADPMQWHAFMAKGTGLGLYLDPRGQEVFSEDQYITFKYHIYAELAEE